VSTTPSEAEPVVATVRLTHLTGVDDLPDPDPTEDYHEASRMYPGVVDATVRGASRLERSLDLRMSAARSVKRHPTLPFHPLPAPELGSALLSEALRRRRSRREYADVPISETELATVLAAAYGPTFAAEGTTQSFRSVPSGGALYPLELYVACHRVDPLDGALYHFDPLRHGLELLRPLDPSETARVTPYDELVAPSAAVVLVTGVFWRSRFKYGARAYRFTLMEAGHVGQNIALAAAALELATVPLGGFFDRRADELLGLDGLTEASLYLFPLGRARPWDD
jgi:SagB-type dehydrogenase family enzyme